MHSSSASGNDLAGLIFVIRRQRVMLDFDLARLYSVTTKRLNEQVKRNTHRFPTDFMFRLTASERNELVAKCDRLDRLKHSSSLPHVFTEHGAVMLTSILNSKPAVAASIQVVRAFVKLRQMIAENKRLAAKFEAMEKRMDGQDQRIHEIFSYIRGILKVEAEKPKRKIGFYPS